MSTGAIRSLLAAVDFGDASARAVALAGTIANRHGATLSLLHSETIEVPAYFTEAQVGLIEAERQKSRSEAEKFLIRFGRDHTSHPFSAIVDEGAPTETVLKRALHVDLVVMGTHGRRGPARWWLGSVAERVLHDVDRPLMIVRSTDAGQPVDLFQRVAVHAAAPLVGDRTLQYASDLVAPFGASVIDVRYQPIEPAIAKACATLLVVAMPHPKPRAWFASYGEPLIRSCAVPMLFVPDV